MRRTLLAIVAVVPLASVAAIALPVLAQPAAPSAGAGEGSCLSQSAQPAGPIDLDKIPVKPVTGPQAVKGVGDECDDLAMETNRDDGVGAEHNDDLGRGGLAEARD